MKLVYVCTQAAIKITDSTVMCVSLSLSLTHTHTHTHTHTQRLPDTAASALLRLLKPCLLSLREHLGGITQMFPHRDVDMWGCVWMSCFRGAWQSLNFDKEYLFGFKTSGFATSWILSIHNQLQITITPKRKENLKSHHMTPLIEDTSLNVYQSAFYCARISDDY